MRAAILLCALALSGCGFQPAKVFSSYAQIEVREVARSQYCNTPGEATRVALLAGAQAVLDWQAARGVTLAGPESLTQTSYALVETGTRPTGGYSLAVARSAVLRGPLVILNATFFSPSAAAMRAQAISSPCVLVQLPAGRYASVEVQDPSGEIRARSDRPPADPVPAPEATKEEAPKEPPKDTPPAAEPPDPPMSEEAPVDVPKPEAP
jgi:hypothetical protein